MHEKQALKESNSEDSRVNDKLEISPEKRIYNNTNDFLLKLDALLETVNRIMLIVVKSRTRAEEEFKTFIDPFLVQGGGKTASFTVGSASYRELRKLKSARDKAIEAERIVPQSFLVSMVSQYDVFLASVIRLLFLLKPEKVFSADKTVTVRQLVQHKTVEQVLQDLVESEIDEVLRESHLKQLQWTAKRFDFTIDEKDPLIQRFVEVTERRNLCVHTGGCVSKQYCDRVSVLDAEIAPEQKQGELLGVNRKYIAQARNTLFETAIRTIQIAWRKVRPDQSDEQNHFLNDVIFELLNREDFSLARSISDFGATLRGVSKEVTRRTMCINRAQAYKWGGKQDEAIKIVKEFDWDASSPKFRLAVAIIKDEYEEAARLMQTVAHDDIEGISMESYRSWPLFRDARNQLSFQKAFSDKFFEPLNEQKVDISRQSTLSQDATEDSVDDSSRELVN
jgi:hypothetical protein